MIKGKRVGLYSVARSDLKQLLDWRNKPEFRKFFREHRELNMTQQKRWFEEKVSNDPSTIMFSVRRIKDNLLLGCTGFVYISWPYRHADISLYIGWKNTYIDNKGYAEETARLMLTHGFNQLSLNKIWTEIYIFDEKKKKLYDKLGFHVDGILRQNVFYNGKYWDSYILSILVSEWKRKI